MCGVLSRKGTITLRSSLGRLSVFGRWNKARYKKEKRNGNLKKTHFWCLGVLWFILGSSLVLLWFVFGLLPERNREGTTGRNLKKCTQIDYPTRSKLLEKSKQSKLNTEYSVMNCYRSSFR